MRSKNCGRFSGKHNQSERAVRPCSHCAEENEKPNLRCISIITPGDGWLHLFQSITNAASSLSMKEPQAVGGMLHCCDSPVGGALHCCDSPVGDALHCCDSPVGGALHCCDSPVGGDVTLL